MSSKTDRKADLKRLRLEEDLDRMDADDTPNSDEANLLASDS
jgi:hypothetical protein